MTQLEHKCELFTTYCFNAFTALQWYTCNIVIQNVHTLHKKTFFSLVICKKSQTIVPLKLSTKYVLASDSSGIEQSTWCHLIALLTL